MKAEEAEVQHTFQGMMAVKPGLSGDTPPAEKVSLPAEKTACVRLIKQSGDTEPRKWRVT